MQYIYGNSTTKHPCWFTCGCRGVIRFVVLKNCTGHQASTRVGLSAGERLFFSFGACIGTIIAARSKVSRIVVIVFVGQELVVFVRQEVVVISVTPVGLPAASVPL